MQCKQKLITKNYTLIPNELPTLQDLFKKGKARPYKQYLGDLATKGDKTVPQANYTNFHSLNSPCCPPKSREQLLFNQILQL